MARRKAEPRHEECPHCGALFRAGRPACPECGSDAETGWREADDIDYLSVEIPDGLDAPDRPSPRRSAAVAAIVVLLLLAFVWVFVLGRW